MLPFNYKYDSYYNVYNLNHKIVVSNKNESDGAEFLMKGTIYLDEKQLKLVKIAYFDYGEIIIYIGSLISFLGIFKFTVVNYFLNKSFENQLVLISGKGNKGSRLDEIKNKSSFKNLYKMIKKTENLPEGVEFDSIKKMVYENHVN